MGYYSSNYYASNYYSSNYYLNTAGGEVPTCVVTPALQVLKISNESLMALNVSTLSSDLKIIIGSCKF